MQIADRNRCGQREIRRQRVERPDRRAGTITSCGPAESAWIAGTTSWAIACWNWLNNQQRYSTDPSWAVIARPATLSQNRRQIQPSTR